MRINKAWRTSGSEEIKPGGLWSVEDKHLEAMTCAGSSQ